MLLPTPTMVLPLPMLVVVSQTARVQSVIQTMVPMQSRMLVLKMVMGPVIRTSRLGASLRDRATLPSPLRGLDPSGGYPSRLRSLTLTARSACPAARCAPRRVPGRRGRGHVRRHRQRHRRVLLATALRAALVAELASLALAGCAGFGLRLGSSPSHSVRRRCRLRRAPLRTAQVVPAQVRTPPPDAFGSALRATAFGAVRSARHSSAVAAPLRRLRRRRFPHRCCRSTCRSLPPGRLWVLTPDASLMLGRAMADHGCDRLRLHHDRAHRSACS